MNEAIQTRFKELWTRFFPNAQLPVAFYYANEPLPKAAPGRSRCCIDQLADAWQGKPLCLDKSSVLCPGGKRYLGFATEPMPGIEFFLSCGIPGKMEGERYKKSPELVKEFMKGAFVLTAPSPYIIFKRWDILTPLDQPEAVVFLAPPDVLSGLFTLAGYDEADTHAVIAPFCAGCGSIVTHPYLENRSDHPRAVLGMFDVSARPWVTKDVLSFAVPYTKFERMIENMEESFLTTPSWEKVRSRM